MDQRAHKLMKLYRLSPTLAQALVEAGYDRPSRIRKAKESDLTKARGIGPATAKRLKEK